MRIPVSGTLVGRIILRICSRFVSSGESPPVHAEYLVVNDRSNRKAIETISERLPKLYIEPPLAFIVKPVNPVDARAVVVPSQKEEVLGVLYLIGEQQTNCFERLLPSVDVIAEKQIIALGRVPPRTRTT